MKNYLFLVLTVLFISVINAQVGIGTTTPNSTLEVDGSIATKVDAFPFPFTLGENNHTVLSNNNNTITLPDPTNIIGREYTIKTDGTGAIVSAQAGDLIDGSATPLTLDAFESITVKAIGAGVWLIVGNKSEPGAKQINELSDGKTTTGGSVFLGNLSGGSAVGDQNTGIGTGTMLSLTGGTDNVSVGYISGQDIQNGNRNTIIGTLAGSSGSPMNNDNILIGYNAQTGVAGASNVLNIGNTIYGTGLGTTTARIGIGNGNNAPNSTLAVNGSMSLPIRSGGSTSLTIDDYTYVLTSGFVTLPLANGNRGRIYVIKNISGNTGSTVRRSGSDQIDGANNVPVPVGEAVIVQSDGISTWYIIGRF